MQSYYIHFIRHGMTVEDNKGKYIGKTDVSLSKEGIDDLIKYDRIYKSASEMCTYLQYFVPERKAGGDTGFCGM